MHGDTKRREPDSPVGEPLVQSVNYVQDFGTESLKYGRYGNTPNIQSLERTLALLDGAEAAVVTSSGMGATACAMLALLRPGDHLLASAWIYGGTHHLFTSELRALGIEVTLVDPSDPRVWRKEARTETRAIFLETPVNPTCRVIDLAPICSYTNAQGIALVIDSTFASPINFRPLEHGADVVIHSTTKYLNGHHDVLGGVVLGSASFVDEVRDKVKYWGQAPDPFACWLLSRGLKTLGVRVRQQNASALQIARWAETQRAISAVHHPGLESHPDHEVARATLSGFGGMLAIELAGGAPAADAFLRKLKLFTHAASLGGVDSLVIEPRFSSHARMTPEERAAMGIPDGFVRLSIGVEDVEDLITDLAQALP
ncbi:MAG: aminotransferase class I/II-fold pyridoxal phosphate-dependent enzyme [Gemmatimonadaceae bacterium]|nr:aminotransferase class I/II-fold pyridoxal phosphate-dependent enzyme [Gemmatimonadaceae bacterium]